MVGDPDPDDKFFLAGRRESWFSRSTLRCAQNLASKEITWRAKWPFWGVRERAMRVEDELCEKLGKSCFGTATN